MSIIINICIRVCLLPMLLVGIIGSMSSCKKDCNPSNVVCTEKPPTNEACQATFQRWFFDEATNSCKQVSYSGCSQKGFATKEECEDCECH
jgi:hypothetical protein